MQLWEKLIYKETFKYFISIFISLLSISILFETVLNYELVDKENILFHYALFTSTHLTITITFSYLITIILFILKKDIRYDLLTIVLGGLPEKRLKKPMLITGIIISILSITNDHILLNRIGKNQNIGFNYLLENGSPMFYGEKIKDKLYNLIWVESPKSIWHIQSYKDGKAKGATHFYKSDYGYKVLERLNVLQLPKIDAPRSKIYPITSMGLSAILIPLLLLPLLFRYKNKILCSTISILSFIGFSITLKCINLSYSTQNNFLGIAIFIFILSMILDRCYRT